MQREDGVETNKTSKRKAPTPCNLDPVIILLVLCELLRTDQTYSGDEGIRRSIPMARLDGRCELTMRILFIVFSERVFKIVTRLYNELFFSLRRVTYTLSMVSFQ